MKTTAAEFHIGIITDSPQILTPLIDLLKSQPHYRIDLHSRMNTPENGAWDVIVDCAVSAAAGAAFVKQVQMPVITLLEQPAVEQAVDLMRAGSSGVADWRDTERVLDLIRAARMDNLQSASRLLRFKDVVSNTVDGISVVNRNYVYELVNAAYLERTRLSQEQIEGHHVAEILGEDDFQQRIKPKLDRC
ncbi:MAG: PAS domain-containing protein, partial [Anaerolinea sp.]|nr:PAS domain-containing protein [Anaerolinea sp.]